MGVGWAGRIRMRRMDKKQPKIKKSEKIAAAAAEAGWAEGERYGEGRR